jgi:hypothetical protein
MYGIEFANRQDGYAYSADFQDNPAHLYWTDDGGRAWRLVLARFQAPVVLTGGRAYALVSRNCSREGQCKSSELASSPVTSDRWMARRLPVTAIEAENQFGWTVFGSNVWLLLTWGVSSTRLLVSHNGGRTFAKLIPGGYIGGFGCDLTATSPVTLWGFCVTGNGGYAIRSTDGGREFVTLESPWGVSNGVQIYPTSDSEAMFYVLAEDVWLARDGGKHFTTLLRIPHSSEYSCEVALASATTWLVLGFSGYRPNPPYLMWRTTNGGRSWQSAKAPTVTATTTVSRADLSRFVALAHQGLREPFEATYRFVPPLDILPGEIPSFAVWSEPAVCSDPEGNFVYETPFGRGTFRFIQTGRGGDYECLETAPRRAWKCVGPFGPQSIGQIMQVEGYRMPMWVMENLSTNILGPLVLSHRTVLGRRLWCLNILNIQAEGVVLCLTKTGQLAFDAEWFVGSSRLELVSLALTESKSVFPLPAKPKPWTGPLLPNLWGKVQCPSMGLL